MPAEIKRTTSRRAPALGLAARSTRRLLIMVVTAAALCGCGYSIRAPFDKRIKTVFVPVLKTQSFRRDVNLNLYRDDPEGDHAPYAVQGGGNARGC